MLCLCKSELNNMAKHYKDVRKGFSNLINVYRNIITSTNHKPAQVDQDKDKPG